MENRLPMQYQTETRQDIALYDMAAGMQVPDDDINLRDLWRIIKKYKWTIFSFFALITITTAVTTLLMRPIYSATALVEVQPDKGGMVKFQNIETETVDTLQFLETQSRILKSKAVAESVINKLDLAENPEINGEIRQRGFLAGILQIKNALAEMRQTTESSSLNSDLIKETNRLENFNNRLSVRGLKNSYLFEISFESFDPQLSADISNTVVDEFVRLNVDRKINSSSGAKSFLQREIEKIQAKLETSEKNLTEFARENEIVDVEDKTNILNQRLSDLSTQITDVGSERLAAQAMFNKSVTGLDSDALAPVLASTLIQNYKTEYAIMQAEYFKLSRIFKPAYPQLVQVKTQMDELNSLVQQETNRIVEGIKSNYEQLQEKEQRLIVLLSRQKQEILDIKDRSIQYNILKREWETNKELYRGLLERTKEVGVAAGMELNNISNVDKARVPIEPSKPNMKFNLLIASSLGLFGGIALAFLLSFLDNTVRSSDQFEQITGVPVLGIIPIADHKSTSKSDSQNGDEQVQTELISIFNKTNTLSEAFRSIRTSLMFSSPQGVPKTVLVTSTGPSEGKTTISCNIASVLSANGSRVLIIDGDLRKPRIHKVFKVPSSPGLTEALVNGFETVKTHKLEGEEVYILPSGVLPPNPAELLGSKQMSDLMTAASEEYDYVIVDCAPVLGLADSVVMTTKVDGIIFVAKAGEVNKDALKQTIKRLRMVRAPIIGGILNGVDISSDEYTNYGQYYYQYVQDA